MDYLFTSERLGFRNWKESDIDTMAEINADPEVMEFFPEYFSKEDTVISIRRYQKHFEENECCYFAVEELSTKELIGFIGLMHQTYEAPFTPCVDIGWRLGKKHWGKGYATEGAKRCLKYGFNQLKFEEILSVAPKVNFRSTHVMEKIGMNEAGTFHHPKLKEYPKLEECVWYKISS